MFCQANFAKVAIGMALPVTMGEINSAGSGYTWLAARTSDGPAGRPKRAGSGRDL